MIGPAISLQAPRESGLLFRGSLSITPCHQHCIAEHAPTSGIHDPAGIGKVIILPPAIDTRAKNVVEHGRHTTTFVPMLDSQHTTRMDCGGEEKFKHA